MRNYAGAGEFVHTLTRSKPLRRGRLQRLHLDLVMR
jgi:hypothetical protein